MVVCLPSATADMCRFISNGSMEKVPTILRQPDFQGFGRFAEVPDVLYGYPPENTRRVKGEPEGDESSRKGYELL